MWAVVPRPLATILDNLILLDLDRNGSAPCPGVLCVVRSRERSDAGAP